MKPPGHLRQTPQVSKGKPRAKAKADAFRRGRCRPWRPWRPWLNRGAPGQGPQGPWQGPWQGQSRWAKAQPPRLHGSMESSSRKDGTAGVCPFSAV